MKKAESKWWSRLLKQEGRPPVFLKVDWDRWVDEDEDDLDTKRKTYSLNSHMGFSLLCFHGARGLFFLV